MKKFSFILGISALALASCSSDGPVNPAPDNKLPDNVAMGFNFHTGNISRSETPLADKYYDFGVWAYKGNTAGDITAAGNKVMDDYMVGYHYYDATTVSWKGYVPTANQFTLADSWYYWIYESMGNTQNGFNWVAGAQTTANTSHQEEQYLRYWDAAKNYTWFYAYAPYTYTPTFSAADHTLTFPEINADNAADMMYAATRVTNATMIATGDKVDLVFKRFGSQVRIAFYGEIKGYDVELVNLKPVADEGGAVFVPAHKDGTDYTTGSYVAKAVPTVTFGGTDATEGTITYATLTPGSNNFVYAVADFAKADGTASTAITLNDKIYSTKTAVVPDAMTNDGFTLNASFKLTAKGTGEVLYVRGARVHVPADYCHWAQNTLYTYVFKITNGVPGETGGDDPEPDPKPSDKALIPIIFDNITVTDLGTNEVVYDYFDETGYHGS